MPDTEAYGEQTSLLRNLGPFPQETAWRQVFTRAT
jgi:hypothetical protein